MSERSVILAIQPQSSPSPRVERISGPEKFGSSAKKDFSTVSARSRPVSVSKRKRLYAIARTFGLLGADG